MGDGCPPLVIAEMGINHSGKLDVAISIADAAMESGAEIIKHQTHVIADEMSFEAHDAIPGNSEKSIYDIMKRCALSEEDELRLMQHVTSRGTMFISTPFSLLALERIARFDLPAIKIGSGECNNYPFVKRVAELKKPVIMSTGMNSIESIRPSVDVLRKSGVPFCLLHCTNIYPTPHGLVRLRAIETLRVEFPDAVIGLSDHTVDNFACLGAVSLGAAVLERHFTDSKERVGEDIACSMDPSDLSQLITGSRAIFDALKGGKEALEEESATIAFAFASVVVTKDLSKGAILDSNNIWLQRPSGGDFGVDDYEKLLGKKAKIALRKGYQLKKEQVDMS